MESARYQGYERRGTSSAFQRVIWNIKRQNIFVCFSDVTHITGHGTGSLNHLGEAYQLQPTITRPCSIFF